jgi:hypothetical protein
MQKRVLFVVLAIGAIAGGIWAWQTRHRDAAPVEARVGSAHAATPSVPIAPKPSARLDVVVRDAKGVLDGALVRLAGPGGDITTAKTGADGTAHLADLPPITCRGPRRRRWPPARPASSSSCSTPAAAC